MTCFTTRHIQRGGGGGVRATFFISEGAKINDSMGPPGVQTPGYAPSHKSHIGQKKCFTPKYREKCIYFVLTEHTFYYEH